MAGQKWSTQGWFSKDWIWSPGNSSRKETFPIPSYIILLTLKFSNIFAYNIPNIILRHYGLLTYTQENNYFFFTSLINSKIYYFWWYFKIKLTLLFFFLLPGYSSVGRESAWNSGDLGLIPGLARSSGEENGNPLQYSCLENSMDRVKPTFL